MNANYKYETKVKPIIYIEYIKKKKGGIIFLGNVGKMFVSDIPLSLAKILQKVSNWHYEVNFIIKIIQIFSHNHTYDFYQEYLRIFECQINRYERTKYMNVNKKYETRVMPKSYIEYLKKEKRGIFFYCNVGKCLFLTPPVPGKNIAESIRS